MANKGKGGSLPSKAPTTPAAGKNTGGAGKQRRLARQVAQDRRHRENLITLAEGGLTPHQAKKVKAAARKAAAGGGAQGRKEVSFAELSRTMTDKFGRYADTTAINRKWQALHKQAANGTLAAR